MSRRPPPFLTGAPPPLFNRIRNQFIPDSIKRLLGLTAEMGTPQLAPELQMSISLFNDPEFQVLLGGSLWGRFVGGLAASVGNNGIVAVVNPVGSGELARVEFAEADNTQGTSRVVALTMSRTALTTPTDQTIVSRDLRRVASGVTQFFPSTRVRVESSNNAPFSGSLPFRQIQIPTLQRVELISPDKPCFIAPGFSLMIVDQTVNEVTPNYTIWGRSRTSQGTELVLQ